MSLDSSAHSDSDDTIVVGLEATSEGILVASSSASVVPGFVLSDSLEGEPRHFRKVFLMI